MSKTSTTKTYLKFILLYLFVIIIGVYIFKFTSVFLERKSDIAFIQRGKIDGIIDIIAVSYVDSVDANELEKIAINSVLKELDPHSVYISKEDAQMAQDEIRGGFDGIGVQFRIIKDTVHVIIPIAGGPSDKMGILAGDKIITADNDTIAGKNLSNENVIKKLKGESGSKVKLGILRSISKELIYITVERGLIPTNSVDAYFLSDSIAYIKLSKFHVNSAKEVRGALAEMESNGMRKIILDLRSNVGGLLTVCTEICDLFIPTNELIVYTEGLGAPKVELRSLGGKYTEMPLIVLTDEWSASASEILAGAVQDNDAGIILGRRTFGKGLVQEQMQLKDESILRLTVARYHTPSGRCIQKPYDLDEDDYAAELLERYESGEMTGDNTIFHGDTTKYYTKKKRIVYGGGGILPDVLTPYKTDELFVYLNKLSDKNLNLLFSFDYVSRNRESLKAKYKTGKEFVDNFIITDSVLKDFIKYAEANGVEVDNKSINKYGYRIKNTLKANIGRDLFDENTFFNIYSNIDEDYLKAKEVFENWEELKP